METGFPRATRPDYPALSVGGRIQNFQTSWNSLPSDNWAKEVASQGYKIEFISVPPEKFLVSPLSKNKTKRSRTLEAIQTLLLSSAIEEVPVSERGQGLYSILFTVPKKNGKWRAILDLKFLNRFVVQKHFRMETLRSVSESLQAQELLTSVDLTDA